MTRVFLGGTCNGSLWRDDLIPMLDVDHFNPVVDDWTPECQVEEIRQRETCDIVLYVITPEMTGVYSIAEAVDDSNKRPGKTVFAAVDIGGVEFSAAARKSLKATEDLIQRNGGTVCTTLQDVAAAINAMQHARGSDEDMTFGEALIALKRGGKVRRKGWNGNGLWVELQTPYEFSEMTLPYLYLNYPDDAKNTPGARVPWLASQTDVLAEDWQSAGADGPA